MECSKFECDNMKDDVCRFDDEIVSNDCIKCDLYCRCDRCKHKNTCNNNASAKPTKMTDEELHILRLLTIAAIAYAEWNDIIVSKMRDNKEIAELYMQLPTVQGTTNHLQLLKLKDSKIDVNSIKSIEDLIKVIS